MADIKYIGNKVSQGSKDRQGYNATDVYMYSSADATFMDILQQPELPAINEAHSLARTARCVSIDPRPHNDAKGAVWHVTCRYTGQSSDYSSTSESLYITIQPWKLPPYNLVFGSLTYRTGTTHAYHDYDEQFNPTNPIETLGTSEKLLGLPPTLKTNATISFSYNVKGGSFITAISTYMDTVNKDSITIVGVKCPPLGLAY